MRYLVLACVLGLVFLGVITAGVAIRLPDVDRISTYIPNETTKIYSSDNMVLAELHQEENRVVIPIEEISPILQRTVLASEDTEFYHHHGVNVKGMFRALFRNLAAMRFAEGGSTLTQQLARNLFLHKRKTVTRKIGEIILALQIERRYTKNEILEMYLNQVYWGHNSYGIESAAQMYFGKHAQDLSLAESAMLVGLLKAPELYSPFRDYNRAKRQQQIVLGRMRDIGLITKEEFQFADQEVLKLAPRRQFRFKAPFFTSYVLNRLVQMYGEESVFTSGMRVYTTLNYKLQQQAERVVHNYVEMGRQGAVVNGEPVPGLNFEQGALLAIDPRTGYIVAMQGGVDFRVNQFNRCTQAKRQPGSAFKPFVYLAALEKGFTPGSIVDDAPISFNTPQGMYTPINYTRSFLGPITIRKALEESVNIVAIKLNGLVGPQNVVRVARELGIKSPMQPVLSLPLGANEVTMLELTSAYGVLANGGERVEPTPFIKILDRNGVPLYESRPVRRRVFDSNLIASLVDMMTGVVKYGTGQNANLPRPIAGKTGTTSDYKDAWFIGFTPQLVCAAWVGNDDNRKMYKVTGGYIPALMWRDFMKMALQDIPAQDFPKPDGMGGANINTTTGAPVGDSGNATDSQKESPAPTASYTEGREASVNYQENLVR